MTLPLFPVTNVGSWPRSRRLLDAQRDYRNGRIDAARFSAIADSGILEFVRLQEDIGCDIFTDGELRRDNFYSFVTEKLSGTRLMTLAEMLDVVEDKAGFERLLRTLDVPAFSIRNPVCVARLERRAPLVVEDMRYLRALTSKPIKATLPGPYILTRAMFVPEVTGRIYRSKEDLGLDVVRILREEVEALAADGVEFIQLDEPVLSEVSLAPGATRTFMCAALASRKDPAEELEFATSLINEVVRGFDRTRIGVHVCRGNWSRDETTLLAGSYAPLAGCLEKLAVRQLVLEYATERAGAPIHVPGKELGLGVVNPRTDDIETSDQIRKSIEGALRLYPAEAIFLNPDCGFATFAERPMNADAIAADKLRAIVAAARAMRPVADAASLQCGV